MNGDMMGVGQVNHYNKYLNYDNQQFIKYE